MAKKRRSTKGWEYYIKVGLHLAIISIPAMILAWIINIPLALLFGGMMLFTGAIFGGLALLGLIQMLIGFLILGWLVVKYKNWVFKDAII